MPEIPHHGLPAHEVVLLLEAHPFEGLDPDQVSRRRELYGPNILPRSKRGGLPAAVTVTLAIGVRRMARRRAVVRRLPVVETLSSTTVICSDKTGTFTENQMTVRVLWTPSALYDVSGSGYGPEGMIRKREAGREDVQAAGSEAPADAAPRWCLLAGGACNDAAIHFDGESWGVRGDPTEAAMLVAAGKGGVDIKDFLQRTPRLDAIPFSSEMQYMATLHRAESREPGSIALVKGGVERMLELCHGQMDRGGETIPVEAETMLRAAHALAATGLRALATALMRLPPQFDALAGAPFEGNLVLTGMQAMLEPPRKAAAAAVEACHEAGIAVKMITGDHLGTAVSVAAAVGLDGNPEEGTALLGSDLDAFPGVELSAAVERATVFARVSPEQKLRLIDALQSRGHVVAMTGTGSTMRPHFARRTSGSPWAAREPKWPRRHRTLC